MAEKIEGPYQYRVIDTSEILPLELERELNDFGDEGWYLIGTASAQGGILCPVLERPNPDRAETA